MLFGQNGSHSYLLNDDPFWVITCYFNPQNHKLRRQNYFHFYKNLRQQNVQCLTVELNHEDKFLLKDHSTIHVPIKHTTSQMWHKENLLNIGLKHLPPSCKYVCWLDCDIIFKDDLWKDKCIQSLQKYKMIQPFSTIHFLKENDDVLGFNIKSKTNLKPAKSYVKYFLEDNHEQDLIGSSNLFKGHPGYGWACHKYILDQLDGFYDKCIIGLSDIIMAAGFVHNPIKMNSIPDGSEPNWESNGWSEELWNDIREYQRKSSYLIKGQVGYVQGDILHIYHGPYNKKFYMSSTWDLKDFDPKTDLYYFQNGLLEFTNAGKLKRIDVKCKNYFQKRVDK